MHDNGFIEVNVTYRFYIIRLHNMPANNLKGTSSVFITGNYLKLVTKCNTRILVTLGLTRTH